MRPSRVLGYGAARARRRPGCIAPSQGVTGRGALPGLIALDVLLAVWYFGWLYSPAQEGTSWLYGLLLAAETFNLLQAIGFWWTVWPRRPPLPAAAWFGVAPRIDVLIPTYDEPPDVVLPTIVAALQMMGADVTVYLLDDGRRAEMAALAAECGARYIARSDHTGAKAGNLNHALELTDAPYVAIFDCDHVPDRRFLVETLGLLIDPDVAFVQTPQSYVNRDAGVIAMAAAIQQDLFYGPIARGKRSIGAMFCCGTNVVFRRAALLEAGGFPEDVLAEDFEVSIRLHELGWESRYVPEVLAHGLGPEDMSSYVTQQSRWAEGCLSALPRLLRRRLPWRLRLQYLLASSYFLSGLTVLVYMSLPVLRIFVGIQPIRSTSADQFLIHFVPYFAMCVVTVAYASGGRYTFGAYSLAATNFAVHVRAAARVLLHRRSGFAVTPKRGVTGRQLRPIGPALLALGTLVIAVLYALVRSHTPSSLTNSAFASIHVGILGAGCWPALWGRRQPAQIETEALDATVVPMARLEDDEGVSVS